MQHRGLIYRERGFIERLLPAVQAQYHVGELLVAAIQQCEDLLQHDLPRVDRRHDRVGADGPPRRPRHRGIPSSLSVDGSQKWEPTCSAAFRPSAT